MKIQNKTMSPAGKSRRLALKIVGAGIAAGLVGSAGIAGAIQQGMTKSSSSKDIDVLVHFADTDYAESVVKNANSFKGLNADLLMRSYAYVDYENTVSRIFHKVHPHESTSEVFSKSRIVVSTCSLSLLNAKTAGAFPIYLDDGKTSEITLATMESQQIHVVDLADRKGLVSSVQYLLRHEQPTRA